MLVAGKPIYLIAGGSFSWGPSYASMEGKAVTLIGTLRFYRAPPATAGAAIEGRASDHYYMEVERAKVELAK